jgi:hypothetical protein
MPGILPMKVIKVGSAAQARIAQACDRCRSKKIRCDGIRPSCSQCINVGFECKTSDKLSRRAFPRGYTESLEERVRALEAEVRELKDLLDEKDEKIDMLSRIHSHSPQPLLSPRRPSTSPEMESREESVDKEDLFKIQQSPLLLDDENCDSVFVGTSSGRMLVGMSTTTTHLHVNPNSSRCIQAQGPDKWSSVCRHEPQRLLRRLEKTGHQYARTHRLVEGAAASGV